MGLDTTHDAWHGPYSSFNDWRYWIAKQIDINLDDYKGYAARGGSGTKDLNTIDHPLMPLFNHSDCDGELTPDECRQIAKGLKEILSKIEKDNTPVSNWQLTYNFMKGCIKAANANENIEFR